MSYILEALKKSDQQRQHGATPTLPLTQISLAASKPAFSVSYVFLSTILICVGMAIGWLRPWQEEQAAHAADPIANRSSASSNPDAPLPKTPEAAANTAPELPLPNTTLTMQAAPGTDAMQAGIPASARTGAVVSAPAPMPIKPANPTEAARQQKVFAMAELPLAIQQDIPAMTIQLHSYSSKPLNSIVNINSRMLKEGESLTAGLKLEQITPDGVIFSYKGYRFQHGIW